MARYGKSNTGKILLLIVLIVVLALGGVLWLDILGIVDARDTISPVTKLFGIEPRTVLEEPDDVGLLDRQRIEKQREALDLYREELVMQAADTAAQLETLQQLDAELTRREEELKEKEKSLNEALKRYENKRANLEQSALYFTGMPPQNAVDILLEMEDLDVIEILRTAERLAQEAGESSVVAYWISLMPPERGAAIQREMSLTPGE